LGLNQKKQTKNFCTAKNTTNKTKRQTTEWEKIFANDIFDKGLLSKTYKEFIQLNTKKQTIQLKNGQRQGCLAGSVRKACDS